MAEEKLGRPVPMVLAMVLCDAIYQDPATQKCTLLGTFSTINVRKFPATTQNRPKGVSQYSNGPST